MHVQWRVLHTCGSILLMLVIATSLQAVSGVVEPPKSAVPQKGSQREVVRESNKRNRSYAPNLEASLDRTFLDLPKSALMPISASERRRFDECRRRKGIGLEIEGYRWDCALEGGLEDGSSEGGAGSALSTTSDAPTGESDSVAEATSEETIQTTEEEFTESKDESQDSEKTKQQRSFSKGGSTGFGGEGGGGSGSGGPDFNPGGGGGGGGSRSGGGGSGSSGGSPSTVSSTSGSESSSGGGGAGGGSSGGSNSSDSSSGGTGGSGGSDSPGNSSGGGGDSVVWLNSAFQQEGNKGMTFQPVDEAGNKANFFLTARTMVDQSRPLDVNAAGSPGSIVITERGAGVQTLSGGGAPTMEGSGETGSEELIFHYQTPVVLHSLDLGLVGVTSPDGLGSLVDPVLFLMTQDPSLPSTIVLDSEALAKAFTSTGGDTGWIDFAKFVGISGLTSDTLITEFILRESGGGNILVSFERFSPTMDVPEPSTWMILAALLLIPLVARRHKDLGKQRGEELKR